MLKSELVNRIAEKTQITKKVASEALEETFEALSSALERGEKITLPGFGTFSVTERSERKGKNPQTGAEMTIPASKAAKFKQASALKERLNS